MFEKGCYAQLEHMDVPYVRLRPEEETQYVDRFTLIPRRKDNRRAVGNSNLLGDQPAKETWPDRFGKPGSDGKTSHDNIGSTG